MADMQIAIGFGWETGVNPLGVFAILLVFLNRILHKVRGDCRIFCHYILSFIYAGTTSGAAHFFSIYAHRRSIPTCTPSCSGRWSMTF